MSTGNPYQPPAYQPSSGGAAVLTVNGQGGPDVVLDAGDVDADPAGSATAAEAAANGYTDAQLAPVAADATQALADAATADAAADAAQADATQALADAATAQGAADAAQADATQALADAAAATADAAAVAADLAAATVTYTWDQTFTVSWSGAVAVPAGADGYIGLPFADVAAGTAAAVIRVQAAIRAGTSATIGFSPGTDYDAIVVTPAGVDVAGNEDLADGDRHGPVVTAVAGDPDGLVVSWTVRYTRTIAVTS